MSDLQGMVRAVVTSEHGGVAVSWVGNTLTVTDGADFPRDGGQFIVEGDPTTIYSYSRVTDGATEDDPDIITTVDPAPAGLPTGDEFRLTLWPAAVSSVAEVALPESTDDTVPAIIPHMLKPYLPDGLRVPEDQEAVIIGQRDMSWVVVDILDQREVIMAEVVQAVDDAHAEAMEAHGLASDATVTAQDAHNTAVDAQEAVSTATQAAEDAQTAAEAAAQDAADAAGIAGGKADVLIQPGAPAVEMQKDTTLWIDTTGGNNTPKRWDGSKWAVVTDKAATDAAADAAAAQTAASEAQTAADAAQTAADNAQVTANAAQSAASNAQTMATNALTSANGRNSRIVSTGDPSGTTNPRTGLAWVEGDTWWKWDSTATKNVIGAWAYRNGDWEAEKISHETISSVDVNKLVVSGSANIDQAVINKLVGNIALFDAFVGNTFTGGTFVGADFHGGTYHSPSPTATPRMGITGGELSVIRSYEGEEGTTVRLGGSSSDELMLYKSNGEPLGGFQSDGDALVTGNLDAGSISIHGNDLEARLDALPRGIVARWVGNGMGDTIAGGELGIAAVGAKMWAGRYYRIHFHSTFIGTQPSDLLALRIRGGPGGASISSASQGGVYVPGRSSYFDAQLDTVYYCTATGAHNFIATYQRIIGTGTFQRFATSAIPSEMWLEDLGSDAYGVSSYTRGGGTPLTPVTPPADPVGTFTKVYTADALRSWYGSSLITTELGHGTYGGVTRYSMVGFPAAELATDLTGATITKVEVKLRNIHTWYGSGMTARIGRTTTHASSGTVSIAASSGNSVQSVDWGKNQTKWVTMPAGWWTSAMRSITLGSGASGNAGYGKFSYNVNDCQLRVTYTK
jgi:hypothetical protein